MSEHSILYYLLFGSAIAWLNLSQSDVSVNSSPKIFFQKQNLALEIYGAKLKFSAPLISSAGNLQVSLRKFQLPAPPYFVTHAAGDWCQLTLLQP